MAGFSRLRAFDTIYIADLDAILGRGDNRRAVLELAGKFPRISFWLDAGARNSTPDAPCEIVFGSETMPREEPPPDLSARPRAILSLDFQDGRFLGPPALASSPRLWPSRVIVMTLARIGLGEGPDLAMLAAIVAQARGREIFAAGGVRGPDDLAALERLGVAGVLVATALHDGRLGARELERFENSAPGR